MQSHQDLATEQPQPRTVEDIFTDWKTNPTVNITDGDISLLEDFIDNAWLSLEPIINDVFKKFIDQLQLKHKFNNDDEFNYVTLRKQHLKDIIIPDLNKLENMISRCEDTPHTIKSTISDMSTKAKNNIKRSVQMQFIMDVYYRNMLAVKSALHQAEDKASLVNYIYQRSPNYNYELQLPQSALHAAVLQGYTEVVIFLLNIPGIELNQTDNGNTPLCEACVQGRLDIVKLLIAHGANLYRETDYRESPLLLASKHSPKVYEYLLPLYETKEKACKDELISYLNLLSTEIMPGESAIEMVAKLNRLITQCCYDPLKYDPKMRTELSEPLINTFEKRFQAILATTPYQPSIVNNEIIILEGVYKLRQTRSNILYLFGSQTANPFFKLIQSVKDYQTLQMHFCKVKSIASAMKFLTLSPFDVNAASSVIERYLLSSEPAHLDSVHTISTFLKTEGRKNLKIAIMTCIKSIANQYKDSLAPDHWIHTLPALVNKKESWPVLFALLRLRNEKNADHNTRTWKEFLNLMKTGNFTKNKPVKAVKSSPMLLMATRDAKPDGQGPDGLLQIAGVKNQNSAL